MVLNINFVTFDPATGAIQSFHQGHPHGPLDPSNHYVAEYLNVSHAEASETPGAWKVDLESISGLDTIMPIARLIKAG